MNPQPGPGRWEADRGFVTVEFVLGIALLVLPIALIVLALPTWFARQDIARLAAQQAARAAVIAGSPAAGEQAATAVAANQGLDPAQLTVLFEPASSFGPGGLVTADVQLPIPAFVVPGIGTIGSFHWTATFSERVDSYRSAP
ncbi:MAG TPA: hypothetical protein VHA57_03060 [Actinomycetota bacterium]|nr:hypothetical protein [Actinomycetota bacterium]